MNVSPVRSRVHCLDCEASDVDFLHLHACLHLRRVGVGWMRWTREPVAQPRSQLPITHPHPACSSQLHFWGVGWIGCAGRERACGSTPVTIAHHTPASCLLFSVAFGVLGRCAGRESQWLASASFHLRPTPSMFAYSSQHASRSHPCIYHVASRQIASQPWMLRSSPTSGDPEN